MKQESKQETEFRLPIKIVNAKTPEIQSIEESGKALHEEIEIKCYYEGVSNLMVGTQAMTVRAGDVVCINPYEFHANLPCDDRNETGKYHLFMVPLDFFLESGLAELDLRTIFFSGKKRLKNLFSQEEELFSLLMRAAEEYHQKEVAYTARVYGILAEVFSVLFRKGLCCEEEKETSDTLRTYRLIEPALRHIRDNYQSDVTVDELARLCKISKHYFCRVFRKVMGNSAISYLAEHRLMVADVMIKNTEKSISQIAEACGFSDVNYFCRVYKNYYGMSPGKRRK
ncbi:MAG: helix-turn-helix transcriptional regulator [Clostridia bacterium]|nr:helix-turn-helix transcriptional regulator [Clostridia bacterium]